ncbi:MAG: hypothetical protein O7D94_09610, partial [Planctomycetota bacterium]|nr:hypothetical protein [Planctomycetota bacterium]
MAKPWRAGCIPIDTGSIGGTPPSPAPELGTSTTELQCGHRARVPSAASAAIRFRQLGHSNSIGIAGLRPGWQEFTVHCNPNTSTHNTIAKGCSLNPQPDSRSSPTNSAMSSGIG